MKAWPGPEGHVRGRLGQEERQEHEQADGEAEGHDQRQGDRPAPHRDALAGSRERARAHQPAGADDERLVEQDDAAEERRAREAVAMEDGVERLRGGTMSPSGAARRRRWRRGRASGRPP